ncbi:hypothetical protein BU14_0459s0012 [Porphyra umbilicalis]|uniref:Uncharacterized protein n=1 Tax=Porphyra umbilicalis TaxID=2786 RepID=A0A1X6NUA1_PORUM|nr:hypothetical protein BU14_0459s0012 [Porphyra umbilicalis]|eukprot:OSX72191.1 hypothetical protein BU14_0459s0012 [Porphyra umbilicalis]
MTSSAASKAAATAWRSGSGVPPGVAPTARYTPSGKSAARAYASAVPRLRMTPASTATRRGRRTTNTFRK